MPRDAMVKMNDAPTLTEPFPFTSAFTVIVSAASNVDALPKYAGFFENAEPQNVPPALPVYDGDVVFLI